MDSFTENLLSRARERQKMLQDYCDSNKSSPKKHLSEQNLNTNLTNNVETLKSSSESNISKSSPRTTSSTRIMSDFQKTLNIQNDNFNMEIKVSSADDVRVEVQIEEEFNDNDAGLRPDAKKRLNRLGKLYAGGDDADISSPIHNSERKFAVAATEDVPKATKADSSKRGLNKLAQLAHTINQFEDDLTHVPKPKSGTPAKKAWKPPAPQPPTQPPAPQPPAPQPPTQPLPEANKNYSAKPPTKPKAPNPPIKEKPTHQVTWDKEVLNSLESQGFTRTDSSSRLIYKYGAKKENEPIDENKIPEPKRSAPNSPQKPRSAAIASKAAVFESSPSRVQKDPALLSVSERKALFERNKGAALVPKPPFALATPIKSDSNNVTKTKAAVQMPVDKEEAALAPGKIASKVAALFESKSTISQQQIEDNIRKQRKEEMDVLLNRFQKPEVVTGEIEYNEDATEETAMIPQKDKKTASVTSLAEAKTSGKRSITGKGDSPKVSAVLSDVKRIKVSPKKAGRLYPSLTDIESATETDTRSPTPNYNSSFESSSAESDDANTSFGRDILQAICKEQTPKKREISSELNNSDLSDVLDEMDDYIDEALAYNDGQSEGPTPPKKGRNLPVEPSHSFHYKSFQSESEFKSPLKERKQSPTTPQMDEYLPTHVIDGDNVLPLTHTVSFYRKQQSEASTPVRQISRQPIQEEPAEIGADKYEIQLKITELKIEVAKQEMFISQTSQALNLCYVTPEFMGSTEQVEAERVLLVATHRRQAALHEIQRLEVEKTLRPFGNNSPSAEKGTLNISKIVLPLKQKYVTALAAAGGKGHHVVCLVKYADQVLSTQLVSTVVSNSKNPELELIIPGVIKIENIYGNSTVTFEVYCLQAQEEILPHEIKYHIKKANVKLTPKKSKHDSRLMRPIKESPAGPQVVRSPTFALMGYVVFSIPANKKQWSLNNTPSMSPLEGIVEMSISCDFPMSIEHRGFLTMFQDVSGFGAWHRRWCLLKGDTISYWKYPDDEKKNTPINVISLKDAVSKQVGPVSREICARLHTFLLETERDAKPRDKDSLVTVCQGPRTRIRHLLSADTKEERIEWCNKLNAALAALNLCRKSRD